MVTEFCRAKSMSVELNTCKQLPLIGLGTWEIRDRDTIFAVVDAALDAGYRLIDTAQIYGNEAYVGEALELYLPKYQLKREDVFITSKLSTANQGREKVEQSVKKSLENLKTDYLDLFLIHWPGTQKLAPSDEKNKVLRKESWLCMENLKVSVAGILKSIGVSNYTERHISELLQFAKAVPAVNQCEFHPHLATMHLVNFCKQKGIHFQAYSSFGSPKACKSLFSEPLIKDLAQKHGCTVGHVLLAWSINQQISVIPRSSKPEHVKENFAAVNVQLDQNDISSIARMHPSHTRYCWDPNAVA